MKNQSKSKGMTKVSAAVSKQAKGGITKAECSDPMRKKTAKEMTQCLLGEYSK